MRDNMKKYTLTRLLVLFFCTLIVLAPVMGTNYNSSSNGATPWSASTSSSVGAFAQVLMAKVQTTYSNMKRRLGQFGRDTMVNVSDVVVQIEGVSRSIMYVCTVTSAKLNQSEVAYSNYESSSTLYSDSPGNLNGSAVTEAYQCLDNTTFQVEVCSDQFSCLSTTGNSIYTAITNSPPTCSASLGLWHGDRHPHIDEVHFSSGATAPAVPEVEGLAMA